MSEDERTEEGTSEELVNEETEATATCRAGEDDELLAGGVEMPQGGGCSVGTWVIILLIIAALIYIGVWQAQKNARETAEQEAAQRQQVRNIQLADIASDITTVEAGMQQGNTAEAIKVLGQMDEKLGVVQTTANQDGDTDAANRILAIRGSVKTAATDIEQAYATLQEIADRRIGAVRTAMGVLTPAATSPPDSDGEPGDEPAGDVEATPDLDAAPEIELAPDVDLPEVEPTVDVPPVVDSVPQAVEPAQPTTELAPAG